MDQLANSNDDSQKFQMEMRRFREYFTALLAMLVVIAFIILLVIAFITAGRDSVNGFDRIKDLLLFINPIVGIVLGFYFNKATQEARAEKAEERVDSAVKEADKAVKEKESAVAKAQETEQHMGNVTAALVEISEAAEKMLKGPDEMESSGLGKLSIDGEQRPDQAYLDAKGDLKRSIAQAKKFIGN